MTANTRHQKEMEELKEKRKQGILDVAQGLFMQKGLQQVSMMDIARGAEISRVTLYKYFKGIETIAMEVSLKVQAEVHRFASEELEKVPNWQHLKNHEIVLIYHMGMVKHFRTMISSYEFLGAFDHLYSRNYPSESLAQYYKDRISEMLVLVQPDLFNKKLNEPDFLTQFISLGNLTLSFLEKLSVRGHLLAEEQGVAIDKQLDIFSSILEKSIKS